MYTLKARKIGNSVGVILPREVLEKYHIQEGDTLFGNVGTDGVYLTPYDPSFETAMKAFERTRRKYRNAFRELAKR
ncbi:MAG: AbrB/MazE/SpoVT family DNA-binding domain-containing protein [Acidiferrobacterales bacterium]|jgi:putative addiction module antidote